MPRYIDVDKLTEELKSLSITVTGFRGGKCYWSKIIEEYKDSILRIIDEQATADVVPREEVENYAEWSGLKQAKAEAAREIFAEINAIKQEYASGDIDGNELYVRLYTLEKKYTEGE